MSVWFSRFAWNARGKTTLRLISCGARQNKQQIDRYQNEQTVTSKKQQIDSVAAMVRKKMCQCLFRQFCIIWAVQRLDVCVLKFWNQWFDCSPGTVNCLLRLVFESAHSFNNKYVSPNRPVCVLLVDTICDVCVCVRANSTGSTATHKRTLLTRTHSAQIACIENLRFGFIMRVITIQFDIPENSCNAIFGWPATSRCHFTWK